MKELKTAEGQSFYWPIKVSDCGFVDQKGGLHADPQNAAYANVVHALVAKGWPEHIANRMCAERNELLDLLDQAESDFVDAYVVQSLEEIAKIEAEKGICPVEECIMEIACADPDIYPVEEWSEEARENVAATRAEYNEDSARWARSVDERDRRTQLEIARQRRIVENNRHDYHED